jgi:hypothetical protein
LITHDLEESANMAMLDYEMRPYLKEEKLYGDGLGLMLFSPMVGTKMCEPVRKGCTSPIHTPLE